MTKFLFILLFAFTSFVAASADNVLTKPAADYYEHGQYDSALLLYNQLLQSYPDTLKLHYNRGLCFYQLGQYQKAIADFNFCISQDSLFKDARYLKALSLEKSGDRKQSLKEMQMLLRIDKSYDELAKRIQINRFAVYVSTNWYYMIAMAVLVIVLLATVITYRTSKRF